MLHDDEDPSTLCDVFAQMLQVNEDMIAAIAEHQNWSDPNAYRSLETAHAYQRILHKNLIEMANFVDSLCGVFVDVDHGTATGRPSPLPNDVVLLKKRKPSPPSSETTPLSEPSALLATIQATEHFRARRRTEKEFVSSQLRIREQEAAKPPLVPDVVALPKAPSMLRPSPLPLPASMPMMPVSKNRIVAAKEECLDCHRLGKSVTDCRAVYKHTALSWKTVPVLPPAMYPPFGGMMSMYPPPPLYPPVFLAEHAYLPLRAPMLAPPAIVVPAKAAPRPLKRMCEKCRAEHQSVYQCRTTLGHTAPEWKRANKPAPPETGARSYSRWNEKEMQAFQDLVEVHGYTDPAHMAPFIPTKDVKQIKSYLQRYNKQRSADDRRCALRDS
ncbi:hypothetical protein SPRG_20495 [Saprolegnia parasitica CBS 223.65]|uniref:Myb-like domain-containing protein n=1 Tax=Saprolegnia parasitica (strain CBS 223.65) TaxID=695850 RepID=A0A067CJK6_SAPPC|nr:hypothetical protein SPRG_20495 [Saprolegnia parasitica CBS 223.65]KDO26696.1 hypothetical protein SPRG_20495 [Saprolegnia parasitica CBS 223.65]|eukprot:XP_012202585.1 hypothetical protein SPRG_20495 [Saprolegnia parasitica CBS 223.65]